MEDDCFWQRTFVRQKAPQGLFCALSRTIYIRRFRWQSIPFSRRLLPDRLLLADISSSLTKIRTAAKSLLSENRTKRSHRQRSRVEQRVGRFLRRLTPIEGPGPETAWYRLGKIHDAEVTVRPLRVFLTCPERAAAILGEQRRMVDGPLFEETHHPQQNHSGKCRTTERMSNNGGNIK
jgi:hypothetical protein